MQQKLQRRRTPRRRRHRPTPAGARRRQVTSQRDASCPARFLLWGQTAGNRVCSTEPSMFCAPIILAPLAGGCGLLLLLLIVTSVYCNRESVESTLQPSNNYLHSSEDQTFLFISTFWFLNDFSSLMFWPQCKCSLRLNVVVFFCSRNADSKVPASLQEKVRSFYFS